MQAKAKIKFLRIAPRKLRLVADQIRDISAPKAITQLSFSKKQASKPLLKLLRSAIANAQNKNLEKDALFIKHISVDGGPAYKRVRFWGRGISKMVLKRTSHVTIILEESPKLKPKIIDTEEQTKPEVDIIEVESKPKKNEVQGKIKEKKAKDKKVRKPASKSANKPVSL